MADLFDIAPLTETVTVGGVDLLIKPVSFGALMGMLARFAELRDCLNVKTDAAGETSMSIDFARIADILNSGRLMALGDTVVAALCAAGLGHAGEAKAEAAVLAWAPEDQMDVLAKVIKRTLPNGAGPFVEKFKALVDAVPKSNGVNLPADDDATAGFKMRVKPSPEPSPSCEPTSAAAPT